MTKISKKVLCLVTGMMCIASSFVSNAAVKDYTVDQKDVPAYESGMYLVGTDIPAGTYAIFADEDDFLKSGYFKITEDGSDSFESIIENEVFENNSFFTVFDGEYIQVKRSCFTQVENVTAIDVSKADVLRVGIDIAPGEYKLESTGDLSYYEVRDNNLRNGFDTVISNDIFEVSCYVRVEEGQYIKISRCKFSN